MKILLKMMTCLVIYAFSGNQLFAQGCSDAGFCTIGNYNASHLFDSAKKTNQHEIDFSFTIGRHLKNERFYQPQINYRFIRKNGSFFECRIPFNIAKDKSSGLANSGMGDIILSYNSKFNIAKNQFLSYSLGLRVSFSASNKTSGSFTASYPMALQNGLGTTDAIVVANWDIGKFLSIGAGLQVPIIQYNKNKAYFSPSPISSSLLLASDYRRQADVLIKLTGHYEVKKIKVSGGFLAIYHLADDYYKNTVAGKFILESSRGATINWNAEISYAFTGSLGCSLLVAEPIKTRENIPDGLARSAIFSPKLTYFL